MPASLTKTKNLLTVLAICQSHPLLLGVEITILTALFIRYDAVSTVTSEEIKSDIRNPSNHITQVLRNLSNRGYIYQADKTGRTIHWRLTGQGYDTIKQILTTSNFL